MITGTHLHLRRTRARRVGKTLADMAWVDHACDQCDSHIASMTLMAGATPRSELGWGYQPVDPRHDLPAYGRSRREFRHRGRSPVRRGTPHPGPDGGTVRLKIASTRVVVEEPAYFVYCQRCGTGQLVEPPAHIAVDWYRGPRREVSIDDFATPTP